jgi:RimJ/RimL family protein N-acetyltransferase
MGMRRIPIDGVIVGAVESGDLERAASVRLGPCSGLVCDVVSQTQAMLVKSPRDPQFGGYFAVDDDGYVVGTCAFKAGVSSLGEVEIAYFTFPPYEGRGHGSEMALQLVGVAFASAAVRSVVAHTLPESGASTRILQKLGMRFCGEVEDPEDGKVWRWELPRAA